MDPVPLNARAMRPRLLHYLVLESINIWSEHLSSRHLEEDVRRNNPAFLPSIVGLAAIDLIRMGYPLRARLEFLNPATTPGFDIARSPDLSIVLQLLLDHGLLLKPDSYFPNYQLTWEAVSQLERLRKLGRDTSDFIEYEAGQAYFSAALGLKFRRERRPARIDETIRYWVEIISEADLPRVRQLWIDTAVDLYRESDWTGDFTFDPVYARITASPFEYRAALKGGLAGRRA